MRDMEKTQTKTTVAMIEAVFQNEEPKKKPLTLEKKFVFPFQHQDSRKNLIAQFLKFLFRNHSICFLFRFPSVKTKMFIT